MTKKTDRATHPLPPTIAAARTRAPRHLRGAGKKTKNNYLAEPALSAGNALQIPKRPPGASPHNLNAVRLPHDTPERIALYRRYAACMKSLKTMTRISRAFTRACRELQAQ